MRFFQTCILPDSSVARYKLSFAAANFSRNLISGGGFDKVFSLLPLNVSGALDPFADEGYEVVYSSLRSMGRLLGKIAIFVEQYHIFRDIHKGDSIWLYNLNVINSFLFILLKLFKPDVKVNVIVLDFTPYKGILNQNYWNLKLINRADGAIYLADSPLFKCRRSAVLAGVVPDGDIGNPEISEPNREFLLSGVLRENISMTRQVLKAFADNPSCTLHITGNIVEDADMIKSYAEKYENIIFHDSLPYGRYLELLHGVTFQLSTRNPYSPENRCNFPSKIIEALLHNRIVVSTISYPQLEGVDYLLMDSDSMDDGIRHISEMEKGELLRYANQASKVKSMFSTEVWNKTINRIEAL